MQIGFAFRPPEIGYHFKNMVVSPVEDQGVVQISKIVKSVLNIDSQTIVVKYDS